MKKMIKSILLGYVLLTPICIDADGPAGEEINMLFIGNSFTARHHLPLLVKKVIEEGNPGLTVHVQPLTYGGQDLFKYWTYYFSQSFVEQSTITNAIIDQRIRKMEGFLKVDSDPDEYVNFYKIVRPEKKWKPFSSIHKTIKAAINRHRQLLKDNPRIKWDYIVLQSWLDICLSPDDGYAKYAARFADVAKAHAAKVILYITAAGIQNAEPVKTPLLPEKVAAEIRCVKMLAKRIDAFAVVPVPLAINMIQEGGTDLTFRYKNDFHPNQYTAFLTANMFYAAMFKKSPAGFRFNTVTETNSKGQGEGKDPDGHDATVVFDEKTKTYLQRIAFEAVMAFDKNK